MFGPKPVFGPNPVLDGGEGGGVSRVPPGPSPDLFCANPFDGPIPALMRTTRVKETSDGENMSGYAQMQNMCHDGAAPKWSRKKGSMDNPGARMVRKMPMCHRPAPLGASVRRMREVYPAG